MRAVRAQAFGWNGENERFGTPINPACPERVPGGSSSGSGVRPCTHRPRRASRPCFGWRCMALLLSLLLIMLLESGLH